MNRKQVIYWTWAGLYLLTCGLGFIPNPADGWAVLLLMLALGFFVPPALLLYGAIRGKEWKTVRFLPMPISRRQKRSLKACTAKASMKRN